MDTKNYILKDQKTEKNLCFLKVKNDEMSSCINPSNYGCQSIFRRKFFNVHPFDGIFFHYFFPGNSADYNNMPYPRDSRTLTWDRNPKPDRNDPKYFPVNSLPRHPNHRQASANSASSPGMPVDEGMPPPMRELQSTATANWAGSTVGPNGSEYPGTAPGSNGPPIAPPGGPPGEYYNSGGGSGGGGVENEPQPGRGQRLLHRMAQQDVYARSGGSGGRPPIPGGDVPVGGPGGGQQQQRPGYSTLQYQRGSGGYPQRGTHNGGMMPTGAGRSRHYSGLDYASDTEALQSPVLSVRGVRPGMAGGRAAGHNSRTNSLPRTFQREALLRHPELSMEMDRLASPLSGLPIPGILGHEDPMSDSGVISAPENMHSVRKRGE
jgi:hypothetical protein